MGKNIANLQKYIQFCFGGSCKKKGAEKVIREMRAKLKSEGYYETFHTMKTLCNGRCEDAPTLIVQPDNYWYKNVTPEIGNQIIESHLMHETPLHEYILYKPGWQQVHSDNERRPKPLPEFKWIEDEELGEIFTAQAEPWEQNLYPMIKDIFEKYIHTVAIKFSNESDFYTIKSPLNIDYQNTHVYIYNESFSNYLVIGLIKNDTPEEVKNERIKEVNIFINKKGQAGIRFKSKTGKTRLLVKDLSENYQIIEHFIQIYLELNPHEVLPVEKMDQEYY